MEAKLGSLGRKVKVEMEKLLFQPSMLFILCMELTSTRLQLTQLFAVNRSLWTILTVDICTI